MARKSLQNIRSKGERLGWKPLDKIQHITLSSLTIRGRKLSMRRYSEQPADEEIVPQLLIP